MRSRWVMGLVVLLGAISSARGQTLKRAEEEMALAQTALDANDYPTALQHFFAAQTLAPQASGPFLGLGLTYAAIDRCQEAVPLLEQYVKRKGATANPKAEATLADCKTKLSTGRLVLDTQPTGVDVFRETSGQPFLGRSPLTVELPVGKHGLMLRAPGLVAKTVTVEIRPRQSTHEQVLMRAEPRGAPSLPVHDGRAPALTAAPPAKPSRTGLYVGVGVGVGLVVVIAVTAGAIVGTKRTEGPPPAFPTVALTPGAP